MMAATTHHTKTSVRLDLFAHPHIRQAQALPFIGAWESVFAVEKFNVIMNVARVYDTVINAIGAAYIRDASPLLDNKK